MVWFNAEDHEKKKLMDEKVKRIAENVFVSDGCEAEYGTVGLDFCGRIAPRYVKVKRDGKYIGKITYGVENVKIEYNTRDIKDHDIFKKFEEMLGE